MKLDPDGIRRRRRIRAAGFGCAMLALVAIAWAFWDRNDPRGFPTLLLALPVAGVVYLWPVGRTAWGRLAARPLVSAVLVGALAVMLNAAVSLLVRIPQPAFHDEFSYLLAADTFARGRLANPTHPMWVHFEAPHILHQPSYASQYPPGQGMILALGQVAFGRPIAGVWLSAGLACGALTWMLAGWMPGRWALAGGLLAAVHPTTLAWSQNYWGGLVAVSGGALLLGAFRRIVRTPRACHAVVLGIGLAVLANSRPYEGLVLSVPFAVALGIWLVTRPPRSAGAAFRRVALPLAAVLALTAGWVLYYNYRVTGDPLTPGHLHALRTYGTVPIFRFQDPRPAPTYRHERIQQFYAGVEAPPRTELTLWALVASAWSRVDGLGGPLFGSLRAALLVVILLPLERNRWHHLAFLASGVFLLGWGAPSGVLPHYGAPVAGLALLFTLLALRRVGLWRAGRIRLGFPLAGALWLFALTTLALESWGTVQGMHETGWQYDRARIAAELSRSGQRHLVIVRYVPTYPLRSEWVYNSADIDSAPVVWARDMGQEGNARLLDHFRDRQVWLVEPDHWEVRRAPYPGRREPSSPSDAATGG